MTEGALFPGKQTATRARVCQQPPLRRLLSGVQHVRIPRRLSRHCGSDGRAGGLPEYHAGDRADAPILGRGLFRVRVETGGDDLKAPKAS